MLQEEKSKEERGRSDVSPSSSYVEEENESVPAGISSSAANCDLAKVTAYRRLTFKRGQDFDSVQAGIEFSAPKSHAIQVLKGELESLRRVLEEEKRETIARTEPTPAQNANASAPSPNAQNPEPDPYDSLPWHPSRNDRNLSMIRVDEKLSPPGRELYQKLKAERMKTLRIGDRCYKVWLTADGAEFLQKWARPRGGR
jgi:hypothetical protein